MSNFPSSPNESDLHTSASLGIQFIFTDSKWKVYSRSYSYKGDVLTSVSGNTTVNLSNGNFFSIDLSENTTISFTNPPPVGASQRFYILVKANINASITYPTSVVWGSGTPAAPASGQTDLLEFRTSDNGTLYYGKLKEDNVV